jgi:type VI secretion system protein ImpF
MARVDSQQPLLPSLLDRLTDDETDVSTEPAWAQSQNVSSFKATVCRDLEWLLNTRQARVTWPGEWDEAFRSVLTVGLPDFSAASPESNEDREKFRQAVERCIQAFEPRLRQVQVTLRAPTSYYDKKIHLVVDAMLWLEPNPEPVTFDTVVRSSNGQCDVRSRG